MYICGVILKFDGKNIIGYAEKITMFFVHIQPEVFKTKLKKMALTF